MSDSISPHDIHYIYGSAEATVCHLALDGHVVAKRATPLGDGATPDQLAFPDLKPEHVFYARGPSASLLTNPVIARAIVDLAVHGDTDLLARTRAEVGHR
ncbi:MAG TPA: hypothetical protein VFB54_14160 [Burkholderiales bacterium]|nr:hypothetical protein [Burkholderiales bacterium]